MSFQQILVHITDAIIIPSLIADMPEIARVDSTSLLKIQVFVENPENVVQLRISKGLLVNAFKELDFFNQEQMKAYVITVSGALDSRDSLANIRFRYGNPHMSILVTLIEVNPTPLSSIPTFTQKFMDFNSVITGIPAEQVSSNHIYTSNGRSNYVALPTLEPPVGAPHRKIPDFLHPRVLRRRHSYPYIRSRDTSALFTLSAAAAAAIRLPGNQQEEPGPSSRSSTSSSSQATHVPLIIRPIPVRAIPWGSFSLPTILEVDEPSSSTTIYSQATAITSQAKVPEICITEFTSVTSSSVASSPKSWTLTHRISTEKREREADQYQYQAQEQEYVRRSTRIRNQKAKVKSQKI